MGKSEKVGSNSCLYSDTKKNENVLNGKKKSKTRTCFQSLCKYLFLFLILNYNLKILNMQLKVS